jgi:uncharacterized membrane protein
MIVLAIGLLVILPLVFALIALSRSRKLQQAHLHLQARLSDAETEIRKLRQGRVEPDREENVEPERTVSAKSSARSEAPRQSVYNEWARNNRDAAAARTEQKSGDGEDPISATIDTGKVEKVEEALTSRWFIWLGAPLFALGGLFFVRHAVELGWLTPWVRIVLGLAVGIGLAVGGEWLRRRPLERAVAALKPNYVPPALTSAGLFVAFASIFTGYALHDLFSPLLAFVLLALVSIGGVGLSLLQGRFVAVLGIAAAFGTPAMVATPDPSGWALFTYLAAVGGACLLIVRYERWWWLAAATLGAMILWPCAWMLLQPDTDPLAVSAYLVGLPALFLLLPVQVPEDSGVSFGAPLKQSDARNGRLPLLAVSGALFLQTIHTIVQGLSVPSVLPFAILVAATVIVSRRKEQFSIAAPGAAAATVAAIAFWPLGAFDDANFVHPAPGLAGPHLMEGPAYLLILAGIGFAAFFAVSGFLAIRNARFPLLWCGISMALPLATVTIIYWRLTGTDSAAGWSIPAVGIAGMALFAANWMSRRRNEHGMENALAVYAVGVTAAVALGLAMVLQESWLTVALSAMPLAIAWVAGRTGVTVLLPLSTAVAVFVVVRLLVFPVQFDYAPATGHFGPVLYGYGLPAVLLLAASWLLQREGEALSARLHFAAGVIAAAAFATLQVRVGLSGSTHASYDDLVEVSLQSILWFGIGLALLRQFRDQQERILRGLALVFLGIGSAQIIIMQLFVLNPLISHTVQIALPLANPLLLAYGMPALLVFSLRRLASREGWGKLARISMVFIIVLLFTNLTLEVRNLFAEGLPIWHGFGSAELYAHSAAWTLFAFALLGLGLWRDHQSLRFAGLGILGLTLAKLFVIDMSELDGLYRVAAFIGLGASLVATGFVYQRVMIARGPPELAEK